MRSCDKKYAAMKSKPEQNEYGSPSMGSGGGSPQKRQPFMRNREARNSPQANSGLKNHS